MYMNNTRRRELERFPGTGFLGHFLLRREASGCLSNVRYSLSEHTSQQICNKLLIFHRPSNTAVEICILSRAAHQKMAMH